VRQQGIRFFKPRIVVCVPSGVTEVEKRAVREAAMQAGARKTYLIEDLLRLQLEQVLIFQRLAEAW